MNTNLVTNPNASAEIKAEKLKNKTWFYIGCVLFSGVAMIIILSFYESDPKNFKILEMISRIGVGLLIGGASLSAGGFMGFIFGIPSLQQNTVEDKERATVFKYNDNLVQISDWLTKIIVGVGLTQLNKMPQRIMLLGEYLKPNFGGNDWGRNASLAIVFYFLLFGFLMLYFWTRTDFTIIMRDTDKDLQEQVDDLNNKLDVAKEKLQDATIENRKTKDDMQAVVSTFSATADEIKQKREEIRRSPDVPDDPQKGKWGGVAEKNDRQLTASVFPTSFNDEWYTINLEVSSNNPANPLTGKVVFHIHPSFPSATETVEVKNGVARLQLVSYGSFTVGAECDFDATGTSLTQLELDLAELPGVSKEFKDR